ncbi:hypothetical protein RFI_01976, partial [Reticulomyxa filosa]
MNGSEDDSDLELPTSAKREEARKNKAIELNAKLDNRLRRLWDFTNREKHALQRCFQQFGQLPAAELLQKTGDAVSTKIPEQLDAYFYSLMSQVEYLVRVERLKDLIRDNKIALPEVLWKKFDNFEEPKKLKPSSSSSSSSKKSGNEESPSPNFTPLHESVVKLALQMLGEILSDEKNQKYFKQRHRHGNTSDTTAAAAASSSSSSSHVMKVESDSTSKLISKSDIEQTALDLTDLMDKLRNNEYGDVNTFLEDIELVLAEKQTHHPNDDNVQAAIENVRSVTEMYAPKLVFAQQQTNTRNTMDHTPDPPSSQINPNLEMTVLTRGKSESPSATSARNRKYKFIKSDLEFLNDNDYAIGFGLKRPTPLFAHHLTAQLATKIWRRVQMWSVLRPLDRMTTEERDQELGDIYNKIKAAENESNCPSKLPNWWYPPKHDKLIVDMTLKYGLGDVSSIMNDSDFQAIVDPDKDS